MFCVNYVLLVFCRLLKENSVIKGNNAKFGRKLKKMAIWRNRIKHIILRSILAGLRSSAPMLTSKSAAHEHCATGRILHAWVRSGALAKCLSTLICQLWVNTIFESKTPETLINRLLNLKIKRFWRLETKERNFTFLN